MARNLGGLEPREHLILACRTYSGDRVEYWVDRHSPIYHLVHSWVTDGAGMNKAYVEETLTSATGDYRPALHFDPDEHELFSGDLLREADAVDIYTNGEGKYLVTQKHARNVDASWKRLGGLEILTAMRDLNRIPKGTTRTVKPIEPIEIPSGLRPYAALAAAIGRH